MELIPNSMYMYYITIQYVQTNMKRVQTGQDMIYCISHCSYKCIHVHTLNKSLSIQDSMYSLMNLHQLKTFGLLSAERKKNNCTGTYYDIVMKNKINF